MPLAFQAMPLSFQAMRRRLNKTKA